LQHKGNARRNHEVAVEEDGSREGGAKRGDDRGTEGEVGDEVA
jgi:hypothetical protein